MGKSITAEKPTDENKDQTLPDPSTPATVALLILVCAALGAALLMNWQGWTGKPFVPSASSTANFALFAAFYVAAQVIERLMQLIAPLAVFWTPWDGADVVETPHDTDERKQAIKAIKAAHLKADRAVVMLGVASLAGVVVSCAFGLYFLAAVGISTSHTADAFFTGITIAAGTKPLHDLTNLIQNQTTPTTGTGAS